MCFVVSEELEINKIQKESGTLAIRLRQKIHSFTFDKRPNVNKSTLNTYGEWQQNYRNPNSKTDTDCKTAKLSLS